MANFIRALQLTLPWLSIKFLPKKSIKKYLLTSLFASILVIGMCLLAIPYNWWLVSGGWKNKIFNAGSFIFGPFFVGTLWIFHYTFGNFKQYFLANLLIDSFFAYPLTYINQRLGVFRLVHFKPRQILLTFLCFSIIIYGFQLLLKKK